MKLSEGALGLTGLTAVGVQKLLLGDVASLTADCLSSLSLCNWHGMWWAPQDRCTVEVRCC